MKGCCIVFLNIFKTIILGLFLLSGTLHGANVSLSQAINKLVEKKLPNAFVGIVLKDSSGTVYYQRNAYKHFILASNAKLFTCTAALLDLGSDFKYTTAFKLYKSLINNKILDGNLYIKFTGDPSYTVAELHNNIMQLKSLGINSIRGNIVLDDTDYSGLVYAPGISYDDLGYSYSAPVDSIILNGNVLHLRIKGGDEAGDPAEILSSSQARYFKIDNQVVTVDKSYTGVNIANILASVDRDNNIILSGTISVNYQKKKTIAIQNPAKYITGVIKRELRKCNIWFNKNIIIGKTPPNTDPVVVNTSKSLPLLIKHALKESDNLYADSFLKTMGVQRNGLGTYKEGVKVLYEIINQLANINSNNIQLYDGSGLSRYNLVTPDQITDLLIGIYNNEELNESIITSLPISGVDGTLKDRMNNKYTKEVIKAKTGSMGGVSALSGYIFIGRGSPIIFSIITNGVLNRDNLNIKKDFEDSLCKLLVKYFSMSTPR
jgi:serine-type D-Ala-D-Ala carboxypeptidase/endopeptidase (penicillin-binding protein 4)